MNLFALVFYAVANLAMIGYYLASGKARYLEFPFWAGFIGLGWFFPQAVGGYNGIDLLPEGYYSKGVLLAALSSLALWHGYYYSTRRELSPSSKWLCGQYDLKRLYASCMLLCILGFFFFYKLQTLPKELTESAQWTGAPVKYLFLSGMFKIGFIGLFLLYLCQRKLFPLKFAMLLPCFVLLLLPILLGGRRADMMNFIAYTLLPLWFVRRVAIPRVWITVGLALGIILINAIHLYRGAMDDESDASLNEKLNRAAHQDYLAENKKLLSAPGVEFEKYIYRLAACEQLDAYDYGLCHWNELVFNFVPGQLIGRDLKQSLMLDYIDPVAAGNEVFGYTGTPGATHTGYMDAYASFGMFGFIKFWVVGWIMGGLYRKAMFGFFIPQLLYAFALNSAMHSITHSSNEILIRIWIYFLMVGYPLFFLAKKRHAVHA
jgi:hypothetical protein